MTEPDTLDARGLKCPLPVLKARKALARLESGQQILVIATDPSAPADFENFCEASGHRLIKSERQGEEFHFLLEHS